jgi:hypothetical protein
MNVLHRRDVLAYASAAALIGSGARAQPMPVVSSTVPQGPGAGPLPVGTPWGASLDLSFMTPGTLDPRVSFSRASTATYSNAAGTLQTAATNAPRWDYDPTTHALRGLLVEEARTNIFPQSGNAAAWAPLGAVVAVPTVTANQVAAPDGTLTAAQVVYPAVVGAGARSVLYQSPTVTANPYAFSVYLRGSVGGEQLYLTAEGPTARVRVTLTTAWQRFTLLTGALTAGVVYFMVGTDLTDGAQTSTPAQTVYVWGAQVEAGAFATSYIATGATAVQRAIDSCTIQPANMGFYVAGPVSWMAEFISMLQTVSGSAKIIAYPAAGSRAQIYQATSNNIGEYDGGAFVGTANAITVNAVSKAASTWAANTGTVCLNGGAVASAATLTAGFSDAAAWGLGILQTGTPSESMSGTIRRVRYWPRVLSATELQSVTT